MLRPVRPGISPKASQARIHTHSHSHTIKGGQHRMGARRHCIYSTEGHLWFLLCVFGPIRSLAQGRPVCSPPPPRDPVCVVQEAGLPHKVSRHESMTLLSPQLGSRQYPSCLSAYLGVFTWGLGYLELAVWFLSGWPWPGVTRIILCCIRAAVRCFV